MRVVENVPLSSFTTLKLGGPARRLVFAESESDVVETIRAVDQAMEPLLVVGGGSNLVVADEGWGGVVLRMATRGIEPAGSKDGRTFVTAAAGEVWDEFVAWAVGSGLSGVECLAGIPGLVGAVPMQNVGAYGQDVGETIVRVRAWDRDARRVVAFDREACGFAYRHSVFRGRDRHVILDVTFALEQTDLSQPLRYAELTKALGVLAGGRAPLALVRETIIALRRKKGMVLDPADHDTTSAGSFFTNPILDASSLEALHMRVRPLLREGETMPTFPEADGRVKVSAAWLIERAGFTKGFGSGPVTISQKHALALTHRGGGSTRDLIGLARTVRDGVRERFGVSLENEPVFVGVAL
ncbi:UDP-N-acetylenolpyruvoylglucosamine reductase [Labilithrix luteola]|uniref:UDP-N-acetylenolpyruvoylglucosamine reductase n=1 Tax=Labilithrix luteola TaxID=1391654 RepID=A0A0K1Q621_9BACT|nr:UDP-N-acetylenolpyruvoylglucosamine reductase [Labilithrix luteola]